jgi:two-component sensor histidine kinase
MWPLWSIFDYYLVPDIAFQIGIARVVLSAICVLLILLLRQSKVSEACAQSILLYTAYVFVGVIVNLVPETKMFAFFVGATMIVVAGFVYLIIPPLRLVLYGIISMGLIVVFNLIFQKHSFMQVIENGGIMYFSISIFSIGFSWIHYRTTLRDITQKVEIENANHKLNRQQEILAQQNEEIRRQKLRLEQKNSDLTDSLNEREILLKEIHHRVKNNLQIIASLLNMQSEKTENKELKSGLKVSQSRIEAMAMIHENLYKSDKLSEINMAEYFENLLNYIQNSFNFEKRGVLLKTEIDNIRTDIDKTILCGLIVNELITNSAKYAFEENQSPKIIKFTCKQKQSAVLITINDNGKGLPDNFNINNSKTIGLRLASGLAKQLHSELILENGAGLNAKFQFQNIREDGRS